MSNVSNVETCVCCGRVIPEGSLYCAICGDALENESNNINRLQQENAFLESKNKALKTEIKNLKKTLKQAELNKNILLSEKELHRLMAGDLALKIKKDFAETLIAEIRNHAMKVGDSITNNYMKAGYQLAHEHIIEIIHLLQTQPISSGTINCGHTTHPVIPPLKPVVMCKDCKHSLVNVCHKDKPLVCFLTKMCGTTKPDDFCSYGKRKVEDIG